MSVNALMFVLSNKRQIQLSYKNFDLSNCAPFKIVDRLIESLPATSLLVATTEAR